MSGVKGRSGRKISVKGALRLLERSVDAHIEEIIEGLIRKASEGSAESARILLEYRFGKPKQSVDIDINLPNVDQIALLYKRTLIEEDRKYKQLEEGHEAGNEEAA